MADDTLEFPELLRRVSAGDREATRQLYERYRGHVLRVVRRRLHQRIRQQYDSVDLTQSVWASFFDLTKERREIANANELIDYLSAMAANKATELFRRKMVGQKHNLNRECSLEGVGEPGARQPTPSQVMVADEWYERLVRDKPPMVRQLLELLRQGYTYSEISARTGLNAKAIQRYLRRLIRQEAQVDGSPMQHELERLTKSDRE